MTLLAKKKKDEETPPPKRGLIDRILDIGEELTDEVISEHVDLVQVPLNNIQGSISHLRDALRTVEQLKRGDQ